MFPTFRYYIDGMVFVRTVESPPPKFAKDGTIPGLDSYFEGMGEINGEIDFINVPDGLSNHYDSLEAAKRIQQEFGKPVILHVTCRGPKDAIDSHLRKAHRNGIRI